MIKAVGQLFRKFMSESIISNKNNIHPVTSVYDIDLLDIQVRLIKLSAFKGKKMLIVNTASKCGYTSQYSRLEELHKLWGQKIAVLGFPCNDFGGQEPGNEMDIKSFCQVNYGVTFPLFSKFHVTGAKKHALYKWLTDSSQNGWNDQEPTWNFCKYLVDEDGKLLQYLSSDIDPLDIQITGEWSK